MSKEAKRRRKAMRLLGVDLPLPGPPRKCAHHYFSYAGSCDAPVVKMRPDHHGVMRWYCRNHDPARLYAEEKNRKKRLEEKKERWKKMERERGPS